MRRPAGGRVVPGRVLVQRWGILRRIRDNPQQADTLPTRRSVDSLTGGGEL